MRWPVYFIFAYLMLGLQVGISRYVAFHGAAPNLALIAVLFIGLNAPRDAALLGSFAIGLLQDCLTQQQLGLYAVSYGLVAILLVALQHAVKKNHPFTHFVLAMIAGLITAVILLLHSWIHPASPALREGKMVLPAVRIPVGVELLRVVVTAVCAPVILYGVQRARGLFAFQPAGRKRKW